ncbi:MAG: zinc metalloprotease HtpX [Myxococcota bacterium]
MSNLKTAFLLVLLTVLFVGIGTALGGQQGALIALIFAAVMNLGAYWWSDKVVLRMYKAREVSEADAPELYSIVADLTQRARMPMPRVYVIPSPALNAFATGRNPEHAAIAVTDGILGVLDRSELTGVLAHELSHVRHRDILIGSVAATIAGAIAFMASMARWSALFGGFSRDNDRGGNLIVVILVGIVAGVAATVIRLAISRSREFEADAGAARLLGDPTPLITGLQKLEAGAQQVPLNANPATAHMFIVNPLRGGRMARMFSTHPSTEERIRRLKEMVGGVPSLS